MTLHATTIEGLVERICTGSDVVCIPVWESAEDAVIYIYCPWMSTIIGNHGPESQCCKNNPLCSWRWNDNLPPLDRLLQHHWPTVADMF